MGLGSVHTHRVRGKAAGQRHNVPGQAIRRRRALLLAVGTSGIVATTCAFVSGGSGAIDAQGLLWARQHASPLCIGAMRIVTTLGDGLTLTAVCGAVSVICWIKGHHRAALFIAVAALGAGLLCNALKLLFERERPGIALQLVSASSYSFPSGHSMASASSYGALAVVLGRARPTWRGAVFGLATVIVVCVGVSRVYLRVHYPTDVLAGWLLGLLWLVMMRTVLFERTPHPRRQGMKSS